MKCEACDGSGTSDWICGHCNGSGEGMADGTRCMNCKGWGGGTCACEACDGTGDVDDEGDE